MGSRTAIVIGTNYEGAPYELSGCVNDALDWTDLLEAQGYTVETLVGVAASRDNIVSELSAAVEAARWGARIVVTYSGHGTWLPDRNGDEVDGRDEAWCPDDMQTAGLITDDTLKGITGQARTGVGILVLSDSCYSGTITRMVGVGDPRRRVRYLPPPDELDNADELPLARRYTDHASLISGCAEPEVSYDAWFGTPGDERPNGAFTRAAIDAYQPGMSLAGWHRAIRRALPSADYPQTPQLAPASLYRRYSAAL